MPEIEPYVPPNEWELSDFGRRCARSLTRVLPANARLLASTEPKARQTLEPSGDVQTATWFGEAKRDEPFEHDIFAKGARTWPAQITPAGNRDGMWQIASTTASAT
jgi:hypothetical protein